MNFDEIIKYDDFWGNLIKSDEIIKFYKNDEIIKFYKNDEIIKFNAFHEICWNTIKTLN